MSGTEGSGILPDLFPDKLAFHSFTHTGRRSVITGSETKNIFIHGTANSTGFMLTSVSCVPKPQRGNEESLLGGCEVHNGFTSFSELSKPKSFKSKPSQFFPLKETYLLYWFSTQICPLL